MSVGPAPRIALDGGGKASDSSCTRMRGPIWRTVQVKAGVAVGTGTLPQGWHAVATERASL